jgi:hypothetical protein
MAVDLVVTQNKKAPFYREEWSLHFDDDGYYWYLYPLFEDLYTATGNMIDLYGDARFERHHFSRLRRMLAEACEKIDQQPAIRM